MVSAVDKAIREAGLGLNPITEGQTAPRADPRAQRGAPQGAGQDRPQICRAGARRGPQRPPRRHGRSSRSCEKDGDISEDERQRLPSKVQKLTDQTIDEIDQLLAHKEKEIMQV